MIRKTFPGGWEGDALPSGEYVVAIRGLHLDSHLGILPFPDVERDHDGPRYLRITNVGTFQIAAQTSLDPKEPKFDPRAHVWIGQRWIRDPRVPVGVNPVIWDRDGGLHVNDGSAGSQGYRYLEPGTGRIVTGDATATAQLGLNEWTDLGDGLRIGQTADGLGLPMGCLLWDGKDHRMVEVGPCSTIRGTRAGDQVAIALWKTGGGGAVVRWLSIAELRALPIVSATVPTQPPPIVLPPPVEPKPMPNRPRISDAQFSALRDALSLFAFMLVVNEPSLPYLRAVVQKLGYPFGLNGKRGNPHDPSRDYIAVDVPNQQPIKWDVIEDAYDPAEGKGINKLALPTDPEGAGPYPDPANAVFIRVNDVPPTTNPGTPGPAPVPVSSLDALVQARIDAAVAPLRADIAALTAQIAALPTTHPQQPVSIDGVRVALKTENGHYVCAEGAGGGEVNATREGAGSWETFTLEQK